MTLSLIPARFTRALTESAALLIKACMMAAGEFEMDKRNSGLDMISTIIYIPSARTYGM